LKSIFSFPIKHLKLLSISYLSLPILLFLVFWVKPIISFFLIALFFYSFYIYLKNQIVNVKIEIPLWHLLVFLTIITLWVFISGAGGWGFQSPDLSKHSSIYKDIIEKGAPVGYNYHGKNIYLSAYLGYYITVPLLFGWLGWPMLMFLTTIWTLIGAILGLAWFCVLVKSFSPWLVLFFILIGGLDIAGFFFNNGFENSIFILINKFYDNQPFWAIRIDPKLLLLYQTNTHSLFWGPQHALPCWIGAGMFFYEWIQEKNIRFSPIYLVIIPFWSPFILLGLAPFIVYQLIKDKLNGYFRISNLFLIPIFITIIWFINSVPVSNLEKGLIFYQPDRILDYFGQIKAYLFFLIFEVMIWLLPCYIIFRKENDKEKIFLLLFIAIILSIIPLYKLGKWNDFVQRVSMPSLMLLWVLVINAWQMNKKLIFSILFSFIMALGSWDSIYHLLFSLKVTDYKIKYTAQPYENVTNFVETSEKEKWPIEQSFAPDSASFFRYLGK
jgi:hypothetical protein